MDNDQMGLIRKLENTEQVILGLLSLEEIPTIVEKKLNQLEELIHEIVPYESNLSDEWNTRLAKLWARQVNRDTYSTITGVSSATSAVGAKKPETGRIPKKQKQYRLSKERFGSMSSDSPEASVTTQANNGRRFIASTPVGSIVSEQHLQYFDKISDISRQTGAYSHNVQLITPPPSSFDNGPRNLLTIPETVYGSTPLAMDRLVHNLAKYEAELRGLLNDGNSSVIKEKLTRFSSTVKQIPAEHPELKKQWNDKLAAMKAKAQGTSTSNSVPNGKTVPMGLFIDGLIEDLRQHESTFQALIASRATKRQLDDELNKLLELNEKIPKHEAMKEFADEWKQKISIYLGMYLDAFTVVHKRPIMRTDEADAPYDDLVHQMVVVDTKIEMLLDRDRLEAIQGLIDQMKTLYEQIPEHRVNLRHYWTLQHKWRLDDLAKAKIAQAVQAMGEEGGLTPPSESIPRRRQPTPPHQDTSCPTAVLLDLTTTPPIKSGDTKTSTNVSAADLLQSPPPSFEQQYPVFFSPKRAEQITDQSFGVQLSAKLAEVARARRSPNVPVGTHLPLTPMETSQRSGDSTLIRSTVQKMNQSATIHEDSVASDQNRPSSSGQNPFTSGQISTTPLNPTTSGEKLQQTQHLVNPQEFAYLGNSPATQRRFSSANKPALVIEDETQLRERLDYLELHIATLFTINPPPLGDLEEQITALTSAIDGIPAQFSALQEEWNDRIGAFMMHFANLNTPENLKKTKIIFESVGQLEEDLASVAFIIDALLKRRPLDIEPLERNLAKLNEALLIIPKEETALTEKFNEKAIELMNRYLEAAAEEPKVLPKAPVMEKIIIEPDEQQPAGSEVMSSSISTNTGNWSAAQPVTLREIRGRMARAFRRLEKPFRYGVLDGIKALVALTAKARFLLNAIDRASELKRVDLRLEVYTWCAGKLSEDLYEQYREMTANSYADMNTLINFLCTKLVEHWMATHGGGAGDVNIKTADAREEDKIDGGGDGQLMAECSYCHLPGHRLGNCPLRREILCFNCFHMGHAQKYCPNETIKVHELVL